LLDELAALGSPRPILILTGGDCLARRDLTAIVDHARTVNVPVAIAPSVSPNLTPSLMGRLRELGVRTASVSLDGIDGTHDELRGVRHHFQATLRGISMLKKLGYTVQVNTTISAANLDELADVVAQLKRSAVDIWELFFVIATGRGANVAATSPEQNEDICNFLVDASRYGMTVRTVEAPFYRRVVLDRLAECPGSVFGHQTGATYDSLLTRLHEALGPPPHSIRAPSVATRDGKGIVFVAANGEVFPSGFLPVSLGSIRETPLVEIYRNHPLLQSIRSAAFPGVCGSCRFTDLCGGSRSRAYASSGDPLGDDPGCVLVTHNDSLQGRSRSKDVR
jgi:radical SAM protein with 4Fe4S-binding SPASM domain